ncbi:MAG: ComF family protein [Patescibacteria group bacterium]|jgi:ComF family protein
MTFKKFLLDLLFPINCLGCRAEGIWLCEKCFRRLKFNTKEYFLKTPYLKRIFLAGDYDDELLAKLIKHLKFNSLEAIGLTLGRFLVLFWQGIIFNQNILSPGFKNLTPSRATNILVIPVPLSLKRYRARGFNQAEIIARYFSDQFGYELNLNLKRIKHRRPQSSLGEAKRQENIKDAFAWTGPKLTGQTIVLIDDVVTTGATLNESARILKSAGSGDIYGLVLAKG